MSFKVVVVAFVALILAFAVGWLAGSSGRAALQQEVDRGRLRAEFAEARADTLDGRVNASESNFGNAVERFQRARNLVGTIEARLRAIGQAPQADRLEEAGRQLRAAQEAAAALDGSRATTAAAAAFDALNAANGH
jgi:lipopolysaccharide biosynthesis regulator YciM